MKNENLILDNKSFTLYSTTVMDMNGLVRAIRHNNLGVRWRAALALGDLGEPAVKPLIRALKEHDQDVRWLAALALGKIGR